MKNLRNGVALRRPRDIQQIAGELADAVHLELGKLERKSSERTGLTRNAGGTVEVNLKRDSPDSLPSAGKASW